MNPDHELPSGIVYGTYEKMNGSEKPAGSPQITEKISITIVQQQMTVGKARHIGHFPGTGGMKLWNLGCGSNPFDRAGKDMFGYS